MKWMDKEHGEVKQVQQFLLFPMHIGKETRWLEWANIKYEYRKDLKVFNGRGWDGYSDWVAIAFLEDTDGWQY